MANLSIDCAGIKSPNPFWLASGPPANTGKQVLRAFDMGWGGAVWKTLGQPIINTTSRYGGLHWGGRRLMGLNNIELITDRPLEINLAEISECKKHFPDHAVIASLMVETREEWIDIVKRCEDAGADGLELNFGCPHGMCERGMGSAVGQEPKVCREITSWVAEVASIPVLVKLTPNITNVIYPGRAAVEGGADGLSLINTIQSVIGVDLDTFAPQPTVGGRSSHGGYCGPAVKPIALRMIGDLARDDQVTVPISGIGGVENWRDAAEMILLGATSIQVCTAVMHYGFRIIEDMVEGLENYLREKGMSSVHDLIGQAIPRYTEWGDLNLNYKTVAEINSSTCIQCQLCHVACRDSAYDCIDLPEDTRVPVVVEDRCVGCNLCYHVCPVPDCITMVERDSGKDPCSWNEWEASGRSLTPTPGSYDKI